jgi:hypothetical protein
VRANTDNLDLHTAGDAKSTPNVRANLDLHTAGDARSTSNVRANKLGPAYCW